MFEKVNPMHPDKIADRIAGAIVDIAYIREKNPKIAVEVLVGHGKCTIITESSVMIPEPLIQAAVVRVTKNPELIVEYIQRTQDAHLANNQQDKVRCGDNGIFKGMPITAEQAELTEIARRIYSRCAYDGKYILDKKSGKLILCQSHVPTGMLRILYPKAIVNPLGDWTGGTDVDAGATNRKLGSDMGDSITGGGLHGKDLSKADVSVNIYAWLKAQKTKRPVELFCAIGDETVDGKPYEEIVNIAKEYIQSIGGFEKFAEWGLIR